MNCPFYAHALHQVTRHLVPELSGWMLIPNPGSNQCALITGAHSPCCMEVDEKKAPDWSECFRNPERNGTGPWPAGIKT
jgi:hypothetical protein